MSSIIDVPGSLFPTVCATRRSKRVSSVVVAACVAARPLINPSLLTHAKHGGEKEACAVVRRRSRLALQCFRETDKARIVSKFSWGGASAERHRPQGFW